MDSNAPEPVEKYWIRNEHGRVWGPFSLSALGRVDLGQRDGFERIQVSVDGRSFQPGSEFPQVQQTLERAAALAPPPKQEMPAPAPSRPRVAGPSRPRMAAPVPKPEPPPPPPEDPGPPEFGTLAEHSIINLYARAASQRVSGQLVVNSDKGDWILYFKSGTPNRIDSHDAAEELSAFLVERGTASQEDVDRAHEITGGDVNELLEALVSLEIVDPQQLFSLLGEFSVRQLQRIFTLDDGDFAFDSTKMAPQPAFPIGSRWQLLSQAVRSLPPGLSRRKLGERGRQAVYRSSNSQIQIDDLGLTALETRVVQHFDGTRSPELVARDFPGEREVVIRTALLLGDVGSVSFGPDLGLGTAAGHVADDDAPAMEKRSAFETSAPRQPTPETNVDIGRMPLKSVAVRKPADVPPAPAPAARPPQQAPVKPAAKPPVAPAAPKPLAAPATAAPQAQVPKDRDSLKALLEKWQKLDFFEILGVPRTATRDQAKAAFFRLARQYHPDTATDRNDVELAGLHADLTSILNEAHATLENDTSRASYLESLVHGGVEPVDVAPIFQAEEDFLRATIMVKARKYEDALTLLDSAIAVIPKEADFIAWRAWARFGASKNKRADYEQCMAECMEAVKLSPHCSAGHLFIGQMSKLTGDQKRAEKAFKAVLAIEPDNIEARRELRLFASRS